MGLLKPRWEQAIQEVRTVAGSLREEIATLQQEVSSLRGRVRACENQGAAANSRCERLETRLGSLEHQVRLPGIAERTYAPGDEDAEPLARRVCHTCRGARVVDADPMGYTEATCSTCGGLGSVETVP